MNRMDIILVANPGIGKTRFTNKAIAILEDQGFYVLRRDSTTDAMIENALRASDVCVIHELTHTSDMKTIRAVIK